MLYQPTAQRRVSGQHLTTMRGRDIRRMRRRMQVIFQDPYASLNPRMTVGSIIGEPIVIHNLAANRRERKEKVQELMRIVGLNPYYANRYPHEFSGRQRSASASPAPCREPTFIVCDEPISAWTSRSGPDHQPAGGSAEFHLTYLFIAHDLSVVRHISDRVAVMYLGKLMELADRIELYENPLHPYTKALLSAIPIPDPAVEATRERIILVGDVPSPMHPPPGCVFQTRCPIASDAHGCRTVIPEWRNIGVGGKEHWVACHRV
jgi:oligopeptide transport system ATP-binding protein